MIIAIAHELMHAFVGFLTGYDHTRFTPEATVFLSDRYAEQVGGKKIGEAGRFWEQLVLGGSPEAFEVRSHPLGNRQLGELWLLRPDRTAAKIRPSTIQLYTTGSESFQCFPTSTRLIKVYLEDFVFPLMTYEGSIPLANLARQVGREMVDVRREEWSGSSSGSSSRSSSVRPRAASHLRGSIPQHTRYQHGSSQNRGHARGTFHVYTGREFEVLRRIPSDPRYLSVRA